MFTQKGWQAFAPERLKAFGVWPNQLHHNHETGEGALVVQQSSRYEEYALSQAGLDYLLRAVKEERIVAGFVVLQNRRGEEVARKPVDEVAARLDDVPPKTGALGPYWWMSADLTPYGVVPYSEGVPF